MYHLNLLDQASGGRWKFLRVSGDIKWQHFSSRTKLSLLSKNHLIMLKFTEKFHIRIQCSCNAKFRKCIKIWRSSETRICIFWHFFWHRFKKVFYVQVLIIIWNRWQSRLLYCIAQCAYLISDDASQHNAAIDQLQY